MNTYVWVVIIGGAILTILPKVLPLMIISKVKLNDNISKFLKYIPVSILAALVISEIFINDNKIYINKCEIIASALAVIVGIKKNNLLLTVIVGVISIALLRFVFGQ